MGEPTKEELRLAQYNELENFAKWRGTLMRAERAEAKLTEAESLNTRYLSALEQIRNGFGPPASIAREALAPDTGTENE